MKGGENDKEIEKKIKCNEERQNETKIKTENLKKR